MSLKRMEEEAFLTRFREFDEARIYIEDMRKDKELTFDAIDYMIYHKEYYFLLDNLYKNFADNGGEEIVEYLFARLDVCMHRDEDLPLLKKLWSAQNSHLKKELFGYIVECGKANMLSVLKEEPIDFDFFVKVGYSRERADFLQEAFAKRVEELRAILKFFDLYEDSNNLREKLRELDAKTE